MKAFFVLVAVIAAALAVPHPTMVQQEFEIFKSVHQKVYDNDVEEIKRLAIFRDNLMKIEEHNKLYEQGLSTYKMGVTVFADMTTEEFMAYVNSSRPEVQADEEDVVVSTVNAPVSIDWRQRGIVTPVKNQQQCGSCWAFSATGAIEGQYAIKHKQLLSLSEQNLVDCSYPYGNGGCHGGWMDNAFNYVRDHGIASEQAYPYHASVGVCRSFVRTPVRVSGFIDFRGTVANVQAACATYGPLACAIYVSSELQHYQRGIFVSNTCENQVLNHGVLLVAYDNNSWTVKNSWGAQWGEGGFFRISNRATACGLITRTSVPKVV